MIEAAANGLGVAMCPEVIALDNVNNNNLIAPLGFTTNDSEYGLIYLNATELTKEGKILRQWLHDQGEDLRNINSS